ncbi:MAG: hypothetical protein AAFZ49_13045, partial [Cyanobacteria bacterium J06659_2]
KTDVGYKMPRWVRASKSPKNLHIYVEAGEEHVFDNYRAAGELSNFLMRLHVALRDHDQGEPYTLPDVFELPNPLIPTPVSLEAQEPPSESSPE